VSSYISINIEMRREFSTCAGGYQLFILVEDPQMTEKLYSNNLSEKSNLFRFYFIKTGP